MKIPGGLFAALLLVAGCGGEDASTLGGVSQDCNPLGGGACILPFPSSIYQKDDPSTVTGKRVDFPLGSLPTNIDDITIDPTWVNRWDGFSANPILLASFENGVDPSSLPPQTAPEMSLDASSPTVIVDMETNERVLHFAEIDRSDAGIEPADQALIIRPLVRLEPSRRYAVGIRKSLKDKDGQDLPISGGFQAILDGKPTKHERLEGVRSGYDAIFASLAAAGVPKEDLVVAWDFFTASDELVNSDMTTARDRALVAMGDKGANLTFQVTEELDPGDTNVTARRFRGTFDVPLVLTDEGRARSVLARDAEGKPEVVGTYQAPFGAIIPACAAARKPVPVLIYGHGLFGSLDETLGGYPRRYANNACMIVVGTEWRGMSSIDIADAALALNDGNKAPQFFEKIVQGVLSFIALEQIVRGPMFESAEFMDGGEPLIDPTRVYYYGISQGGIFGGTFMAYDPFVTRGVLQVGAANYSLYIERSSNWPTYWLILNGAYPGFLDKQILIALFQMGWDLTDPISTTPGIAGINGSPIPNTPPKQILLQMAVGDSQVNNIGTEYQARSAGIPVLEPAIRVPYGLEGMPGPLPSALTMYDEKREPEPPAINWSDGDNGTHGSIRKKVATNRQIVHFLTTGEIIQTCEKNGQPVACDCTDPEICGPDITGLESN